MIRAIYTWLVMGASLLAATAAQAVTFSGVELRHGDLIFMRGSNDIVVYADDGGSSAWETVRNCVRGSNPEIGTWSLSDFRRHFSTGVEDPRAIAPNAAGGLSVGHVAFFGIDESGGAFIFEAANATDGIRKIAWSDWLSKWLEGNDFWIARLKASEAEAARVLATAMTQTSKPYDICNLDLDDTSSFYCSKLVWWAVKEELEVALDGEMDGDRLLWYSPRLMLESPELEILFSSGDFQNLRDER